MSMFRRITQQLAAPFRLQTCGILGMNSRNLDYIIGYNPRRAFSAVDDKIITKQLASDAGIPVPKQYAVTEFRAEFKRLQSIAKICPGFALKPARGAGGGGIMIAKDTAENGVILHNNRMLPWQDVHYHVNNLLSGMFSLGGGNDRVLLEELIHPHPVFSGISYGGIPDIRLIVFRGIPVMGMLRLPTAESSGKANLHMGGIGAGIDLSSGQTFRAIHNGIYITEHPDLRTSLSNTQLPFWQEILILAAQLGTLCDLRYIGADIVIDEQKGPLLLELNARPGLAIQIANGKGLLPTLKAVRNMKHIPDCPQKRAAIGAALFCDASAYRDREEEEAAV